MKFREKTEVPPFVIEYIASGIDSTMKRTCVVLAGRGKVKYEENQGYFKLHLRAMRWLLEQLPQSERDKMPKAIITDEAGIRRYLQG